MVRFGMSVDTLSGLFGQRRSTDPLLEIVRGNIPKLSDYHKFGNNSDIDQTEEDIWDGGGNANANGTYDYPAAAETLYISSSDNGDNTQTVEVLGLDAGWEDQSQQQALAGRTRTEIGSGLEWMRCFRAFNVSGTVLAGTIYIYTGTATAGVPDNAGDIRAIITQGQEQTLMALYTVPEGKTAYVRSWYASVTGKKDMFSNVRLRVRLENATFRDRSFLGLSSDGNSYIQHEFATYLEVPARADIKVSGDSSADNAAIAAGFCMVLADD
jgi:hypothetical protein